MKVIKKGFTLIFILFLALLLVSCEEGERTVPVFNGIKDETIEVGDTFNPKEGVTATWNGIDITSSIEVSGEVNTAEIGVYTLEYTVESEEGDIARATRKITVVARAIIQPIINGADDVSIDWGADFDPRAGVTATWDGNDITSQITITGEANTSEAGVYTLEYTVESEDGGSATITRKVTVLERGVIMPVLSGVGDVTIECGDPFNPKAGVTATWNGKNITLRITVTGEVKTSIVGVYTLVYRVESEDGGVATATRKVTVIEKETVGFEETGKTSTTVSNVEHIKAKGDAINDDNVKTYQDVNVFKQGKNVMVANWSKFNSDGKYVLSSTLNIAKDFELNNPDYEVIAAVNGDFFFAQSGVTYNIGPNILFGNRVVKPDSFYAGYYYAVQFNQFGKNLGVHKTLSALGGFSLLLYAEDGGLIYYNNDVSIDRTSLKANETTVMFKKSYTYDSAATYFIVNQKNQYVLTPHIHFEAKVGSKITASNAGEIVLATKDPVLIGLLKSNQRIIVQKMTGNIGYNDMVIGIDTTIIENSTIKKFNELNTDTDEQVSRNKNRNPRTGFGYDADGKMVLITVDGRGTSKGVNLREFAAIMKHYGIVDGYSLDGGGSTQAVFRVNGELQYVNTPSEVDPYRGVANALLFIREKEPKPAYDLEIIDKHLKLDVIDKTGISEIDILINGESHKYTNLTSEILLEIDSENPSGIAIYYTKNGVKRHLANDIHSGIVTYFNINGAIHSYEKGFAFDKNIAWCPGIYQFTQAQWQEIATIIDAESHPDYATYQMANMALAITDVEGNVKVIRLYQKWVDDPQSGIQLTVDTDGKIVAELKDAFSRNHTGKGVNALIPEGGFVYVFSSGTPTEDDGFSEAMKFAYEHLLGLKPSLFNTAYNLDGSDFSDWTNPPINPFAEGFKVIVSAEASQDVEKETYVKIGENEHLAKVDTYHWEDTSGVGGAETTHVLVFSKDFLAALPGYDTTTTSDDEGRNYTIQFSVLAIIDASGKVVQVRIHPGHIITWDSGTNAYVVDDESITPTTMQHGLLNDIPNGGYVVLFQNTNVTGNPIRAWGCQQLTGLADVTAYNVAGVEGMTVNPFAEGYVIKVITRISVAE
ncbi:MAG: immunoglobulin-like domain-containing protein [Acholeplasmataceae bacterium]|jgi:hypothetical protein